MTNNEKETFYQALWDGVTGAPAESPQIRVTQTENGIALVELTNPPVNIMTVPLSEALYQCLRWLAVDADTKAVIFTSALTNQFCAGGDLGEVVNPTWDRFRGFWSAAQQLWILFHAYPKPIVTVVNGTAPGMGCALVLSSDYRVMVRGPETAAAPGDAVEGKAPAKRRPFLIGLNEGHFGICVPSTYCELYVDLLGFRRADRMLQRGTMVTADEAVELGMIDVAVDTKEEALAAARDYVLKLLKVPPAAFRNQRRVLRDRYIKSLYTEAAREEEARFMLESMSAPTAQAAIQAYVSQLSQHNKSKK